MIMIINPPSFDDLTEDLLKHCDKVLNKSNDETDFYAFRVVAVSMAIGLFMAENQERKPSTEDEISKVDRMSIVIMARAVEQVEKSGLIAKLHILETLEHPFWQPVNIDSGNA